jgi:hypothetical protein
MSRSSHEKRAGGRAWAPANTDALAASARRSPDEQVAQCIISDTGWLQSVSPVLVTAR